MPILRLNHFWIQFQRACVLRTVNENKKIGLNNPNLIQMIMTAVFRETMSLPTNEVLGQVLYIHSYLKTLNFHFLTFFWFFCVISRFKTHTIVIGLFLFEKNSKTKKNYERPVRKTWYNEGNSKKNFFPKKSSFGIIIRYFCH